MDELLAIVVEEQILGTVADFHSSSKPSNSVANHPAIACYMEKLSLPKSTTPSATSSSSSFSSLSSSSSSISSSSSSSDSSEKRCLSNSYESFLEEFKFAPSVSEYVDDYAYFFLVPLEHRQYLDASRILCLPPHRRGDNILKCRDTNHPYQNQFKVHLGNFKKHLWSCHEV